MISGKTEKEKKTDLLFTSKADKSTLNICDYSLNYN